MKAQNHVDTSKQLTHISLCAGYGGIDLALHRVYGERLRTIAFSEIEAFAVENLVSKMEAGLLPPAPVWTDLRTFPWADFQGLDILSGGFPCQPFSAAGKRNADSDPRHLFPAILDGIRHAKPRLVFLENVEGIISAKLAGDGWRDPAGTPVLLHVLRELERVGYRATAGLFSASETGAPHQRKRIFILAYCNSPGFRSGGRNWMHFEWQKRDEPASGGLGANASRNRPCQFCGYEFDHELLGKYGCPNCEGAGLEDADDRGHGNGSAHGDSGLEARGTSLQQERKTHGNRSESPNGHCAAPAWPSRPGEQQFWWEPPRTTGGMATNTGMGKQIPSQQPWPGEINFGRIVENDGADNQGHGLPECELEAQRKAEKSHGSHLGCDAVSGAEAGRNGYQPQRWEQAEQFLEESGICDCSGEQPSRAADGAELHGWGTKPNEQTDAGTSRANKDIARDAEVNCSNLWSMPADSFADSFWQEVERAEAGTLANDHRPHAGHGEQRPERTLGDLSGGCGEAMDDSTRLRSGEPADGCGQAASRADASGEEWMADTQGAERRITSAADNSRWRIEEAGGSNGTSHKRQTQPPLGRDADGPADWLDEPGLPALGDPELAEIYDWMVRCTNRTDELRLLGNGVCVTTGEVAFRTLFSELCRDN